MPLALVIIGLVMVITGVKNTHAQFGTEIKSEFSGQNNFTYWLAAILIIGAVGYYRPLKPFSNGFLALVFLVIILKNGGVFDKLKSALAAGPTQTTAGSPPIVPEASAGTPDPKNSAGVDFQDVVKFAAEVAPYALV